MKHLIDKDALVAEIKRRKGINEKAYMQAFLNSNDKRDSFGYKVQEDIDILSYLNTLEVKEVDLDKKIREYINETDFVSYDLEYADIIMTAKHFFELGLKAQKGE